MAARSIRWVANSIRRGDNSGPGSIETPHTHSAKGSPLDEKASPRSLGANEPTGEALAAALAEAQRELAEARRRESATAEVINVISRSRVDLDAVLTRLTDSARALCGAANAAVHMREGDLF